jgi:hypothetical protein
MTRLCDWQKRLNQYLIATASREFSYGLYDCGQFILGAVEVLYGVRFSFPAYGSRREGFAAIRRLCGHATCNAIGDYFARQLGAESSREVAFVQRGNPVLLTGGRFGLIDCSGCVLTPAKTGLVRVRMDHVRKFWRV